VYRERAIWASPHFLRVLCRVLEHRSVHLLLLQRSSSGSKLPYREALFFFCVLARECAVVFHTLHGVCRSDESRICGWREFVDRGAFGVAFANVSYSERRSDRHLPSGHAIGQFLHFDIFLAALLFHERNKCLRKHIDYIYRRTGSRFSLKQDYPSVISCSCPHATV